MAVWEVCVTCPSWQQSKGCCSHRSSHLNHLLLWRTAPTVLMLCSRPALPFFLVSVSKPWLHWFGLEMLRLCGFSKQDIYCSLLCMQTQPTKKTQTKNKPARCFARALTESTWDTELASCLSNAIPVLKPVFKLYSNSHVQGCLCAIYIFLIKCSL